MTVKITGSFIGGKKIEVIHTESGVKITTDAPKDNNGDGSSFSPTDLVAVAFASCVLTTIAIVAERDKINLAGSHFTVEKNMSTDSPRRIASLPLTLHLPSNLSDLQREKFERVAKSCPVHHSLRADIAADIIFIYDM